MFFFGGDDRNEVRLKTQQGKIISGGWFDHQEICIYCVYIYYIYCNYMGLSIETKK